METTIRQYTEKDLAAVTKIWNEVVAEGNAFPQDTPFTPEEARGTGMGERLVRHSLEMCRKHGFVGLQFNAVVSSNTAAIRLYEKLGFVRIGTAKNGYRFKDGHYEDLFLFNKPLI